ncbi:MAG TPA: hypothetical protein VGB92_06320 [Longimicrobium sp.]
MMTVRPSMFRAAHPQVRLTVTSFATMYCMLAGSGCGQAPDDQQTAVSGTGVISDRFEVRQALKGDILTVSLDSDLPDETEVMVDVSRRYWQAGDTTAYVNEYFEESGTVSGWRAPRQLVLDEDRWRAALSEKQRILAQGGDPFDIGRVEDSVIVSFVVPVNQSDPRFGNRNQHLSGSAVNVGSLGWPLIERELQLFRKAGKADPSAPKWADPSDLRAGRRYGLSRETSLMPELDPADPMGAIARIRIIPRGGSIRILSGALHEKTRWYEVEAYDASGVRAGTGWVSSIALIGQDIAALE